MLVLLFVGALGLAFHRLQGWLLIVCFLTVHLQKGTECHCDASAFLRIVIGWAYGGAHLAGIANIFICVPGN